MRVFWLINHYAQEPGGAGGTRHYALAKGMNQHGWRAIVIAASTELNTNRQRLNDDEWWRLEVKEGVEFLWLRVPYYSGSNLGRLINMLCFAAYLLTLVRTNKIPPPDAILGSSPHPFAAFHAWILARIKHVPFLYEIRDLWPEGLVELGNIRPGHPLMIVFGWMERFMARRANRVITLLPGVKHYLMPKGVAEEKIVWIPNGIDLELFATPQPLPNNEQFTFMYFGAHGLANGLENLLHAMARVPVGSHIRLRFIGDGPLKPKLMSLAREFNLTQVSFEPPVAKSVIPALAAEADAFIFNLVDAPVFTKYGISSNKLFDFMAAGRPVIFACNSSNNPVADVQAGLTVAPKDPQALADAMVKLAAVPRAERVAMGERGRAYVLANHGFSNLAQKLETTIDACLKEAHG